MITHGNRTWFFGWDEWYSPFSFGGPIGSTQHDHRDNFATTKIKFGCSMTQFPVNLNDGTTGHKLQGMSKDFLIITSWPSGGLFRNWEYTVLSRVRTLDGLFLFRPIDMDKSFTPSEELEAYLKHAKIQDKIFLNKRKKNMTAFYKKIMKRSRDNWIPSCNMYWLSSTFLQHVKTFFHYLNNFHNM